MSETPRTDAVAGNLPMVNFGGLEVMRNHARQLERELAAAQAKAEECRVDAERYRWLRDNRLTGDFKGQNFAMAMGWKPENFTAAQVDDAIDAARNP